MILFTKKKLENKDYLDYLYSNKEPNFWFESTEYGLECLSDIFEESDGSLFTIRNNEIQYVYIDYDFQHLLENENLYTPKQLLESELASGKFIASNKYLSCLKNGADAVLYKTERNVANKENKINKTLSNSDYEKIDKYINDKKEMALKLLVQNKTSNIDITIKNDNPYSLKASYNNGEHKIAVHYININHYKELANEIDGKNKNDIPDKKGKDNKKTYAFVYNGHDVESDAKKEYIKDKKELNIKENTDYLSVFNNAISEIVNKQKGEL